MIWKLPDISPTTEICNQKITSSLISFSLSLQLL
jgi:hypothetical protein